MSASLNFSVEKVAVPAAVSLKVAVKITPPLADTVSLPAKFNLILFSA